MEDTTKYILYMVVAYHPVNGYIYPSFFSVSMYEKAQEVFLALSENSSYCYVWLEGIEENGDSTTLEET